MRKNVLILGHGYGTQFIDVYNQYARTFDPRHYEVTIAYLSGEPDEKVKKRTMADHVLFFNSTSLRGLKLNVMRKLLALCREKKFAVVICHRYKPTYLMLWIAQFCSIPALIFVMHELKTMSSWRRRLIIKLLQKKNMLFAGVSDAVRDDMRKDLTFIPAERIITLYNMIDVDLTTPQILSRAEAREALNLPRNTFVFGNIARLATNKDQATLIHAFSLIKPFCPEAKLILIGSGVLEETLKKQVQALCLTDDVIFTGFLPHGFRYMKAFDCFVLSSIQEAFGRVLLEAMLAKIPVIATRVNGIPEVIGKTGILVKPKNQADLACALREVYERPAEELEKWGEECYQRVVNDFSLPRFREVFWQHPLLQLIKE